MRANAYLAGVLVTVLCVLGWTAYAQKENARQQTWEYKLVHSASTKDFQGDQTFNELGAQGWELVVASGSRDSYGITFVFKRPK
jgi:hypothetical protein